MDTKTITSKIIIMGIETKIKDMEISLNIVSKINKTIKTTRVIVVTTTLETIMEIIKIQNLII